MPPAHATLPLNLLLQGEDDDRKPVQFWLESKPSVWVLADYTCETLCGPVISVVSDSLTGVDCVPESISAWLWSGWIPKIPPWMPLA